MQHNSAIPGSTRKLRWLCIEADGSKDMVLADKRSLIQKFQLGLPIRDMRLLDSSLVTSSRGNIAVREGVIVVAIEYVRIIITAERVILPQDGFDRRPEFHEFVARLAATVLEAAWERRRLEDLTKDQSSTFQFDEFGEGGSSHSEATSYNPDLPNQPFELVVLEVALKEICQSYARAEKQLDAIVNPACDALLKKVTTGTLENLRRLKTRHQRLLSQVTTVREELEDYLKDDDDMAKMSLTRKREQALAWAAAQRARSPSAPAAARPPVTPEASHCSQSRPSTGLRTRSAFSTGSGIPTESSLDSDPVAAAAAAAAETAAVAEADAVLDADAAEEVENLLESYFMQIDRTYNRLKSLEEFTGDTEAFINIDLGSSQNRLFRLDIVLTSATFSIAFMEVLAGVLGENVPIPESITKTERSFWMTNGITLCVVIMVFFFLQIYLRWKRLLL